MANAAVTDEDIAYLSETREQRDYKARTVFTILCAERRSNAGIGRKSELDRELDAGLDRYLLKLTKPELASLHKRTGVKSG